MTDMLTLESHGQETCAVLSGNFLQLKFDEQLRRQHIPIIVEICPINCGRACATPALSKF